MKKVIIAVIAILVVIGAILGVSILLSNNSENDLQAGTQNNSNEELITNNEDSKLGENETNANNTQNGNEKILIAYFSRSGNTQTIANLIHENVGGDVFRIQTVQSYPDDYTETTQVAKKEQEENARPELTDKVENIEQYDTIFVGYPNWWGTMPMAVFTFLEEYNLEGKNIIPFCTHEGSALGRSENDIKRTIPNSNVLKGLAIRGSNVNSNSAKTNVNDWIEELKIK